MKKGALVFSLFLASIGTAMEWEKHKQNFQKLTGEIETREKELKDLIHQKKAQKDRAVLQKLLREIEQKHKNLTDIYTEYNKEVEHVKYRHPRQDNESEERSYTVVTPKSLEDIESDLGIDGKLDRIKQKMRTQYGTYSAEKEEDVESEAPKVREKTETKRIILRK